MLKKIASNTISQVLSKFITAFISIFLIGILTKYLSTEMYGQYNKIFNYLSFFAFFADLGLYTISIREISKDKNMAQKIIGNIMSLRLILGIIIVFIAIIIAYFLPGYNSKISLISIFIVSIFTIFSLLNSSVLSLMQSFMKMEFSLFSVVFGKIVFFLGVLITVFYFYPKSQNPNFDIAFLWILFASLVGLIVNYFLNFYYANKIVKIKFLFDFDYIKYIFNTSLPYGIALFLSIVYFKIDIILLSLIEPQQKADISVALYSLPMKIIEVLMFIPGFFLNSALPSLSDFFKTKDVKSIDNLLKNSFRFLFSFSLFIIIFGFIFGEYILSLVSTPDYLNSSLYKYTSLDVLFIVLIILLFYYISSIFNYVFIASKQEYTLLKINLFITIFNIIGNIIFIPKYSFIGSAYVTLISQILLFLLGFYFSRKTSQFKFEYLYIFFNIFVGIIIFFVGVFFLNYLNYSIITELLLLGIPLSIVHLCLIFTFFKFKK